MTPIDSDALKNQRSTNVAVAMQSAPDIRKKLQKLEGFGGMNRSQLLETVQEVYNSQDSAKDRQGMKLFLSGHRCFRETFKGEIRERKIDHEKGKENVW